MAVAALARMAGFKVKDPVAGSRRQTPQQKKTLRRRNLLEALLTNSQKYHIEDVHRAGGILGILGELARGGQIFFVHNNVNSIVRMAAYLQERVPEVRLEVAHGQMAEDDLETVMMRFMQRELDMLVCTTIIESGIDVASANTILVKARRRR